VRSAEFGVRRARQRRPPGLFSGEPEATENPEEAATAPKAGTGDLGLGTSQRRRADQAARGTPEVEGAVRVPRAAPNPRSRTSSTYQFT
jgi:hypothetical protein